MKVSKKQFQKLIDAMQNKNTDLEKVVVNIELVVKERKGK